MKQSLKVRLESSPVGEDQVHVVATTSLPGGEGNPPRDFKAETSGESLEQATARTLVLLAAQIDRDILRSDPSEWMTEESEEG